MSSNSRISHVTSLISKCAQAKQAKRAKRAKQAASPLEHVNITLSKEEKINKAMQILKTRGLQNASQYVINTKLPEVYGKHSVTGPEHIPYYDNYTAEGILAKEELQRRRGGRMRTVRKTRRRSHKTRRQRPHKTHRQ
jgi:hypothetical protein